MFNIFISLDHYGSIQATVLTPPTVSSSQSDNGHIELTIYLWI